MKTKFYLKWHNKLGWFAGIALCLFALSGLLHPLMVWTGPKAKAFFPPQTKVQAEQISAVNTILTKRGITQPEIVKVVAAENGPLLQVTNNKGMSRRYFDLDSQLELMNYDLQQAKWLAVYYSGLPQDQIASVELKTSFDSEYPWVNRLLPVYKVSYDTEDGLNVFVFTETNSLASINNTWKSRIQTLFGFIHTWNWLDDIESLRLMAMSCLLLSVLGLALSGSALVLLFKKRKIKNKDRHWHRKLAANLLWLPLLMFAISGFYHLLQTSLGDNYRGLNVSKKIDLTLLSSFEKTHWQTQYQDIILNGLSLVQLESGELAYRLSLPAARPGETLTSQQRFDGSPIEKTALYLNVETGKEIALTDKERVERLTRTFFKLSDDTALESELITRFGVHYDFRNKRLPVWQVRVLDSDVGRIFIDPVSDVLVDRLVDTQRYETYAFSFLHKWNFLTPVVGRLVRDIVLAALMILTLIFSILGFRMKLKARSKPAELQPDMITDETVSKWSEFWSIKTK